MSAVCCARMAPCRAITCTCSLKSRRTSRSATSCVVPRAGHRARSSRSSNTSESATGANASGNAATSLPHPATSPMTSSCDIPTDTPTKTASAPRHDPTGVSRSVVQFAGAARATVTEIRVPAPPIRKRLNRLVKPVPRVHNAPGRSKFTSLNPGNLLRYPAEQRFGLASR
jgi:hypothetical protein